mmetsp:Transcript_2201/g.5010  ORF Transcript_2201/g.5010 Transcript_2201/m.5010 type:complete len:170 (+) Transcript_2201:770-1279(+)
MHPIHVSYQGTCRHMQRDRQTDRHMQMDASHIPPSLRPSSLTVWPFIHQAYCNTNNHATRHNRHSKNDYLLTTAHRPSILYVAEKRGKPHAREYQHARDHEPHYHLHHDTDDPADLHLTTLHTHAPALRTPMLRREQQTHQGAERNRRVAVAATPNPSMLRRSDVDDHR